VKALGNARWLPVALGLFLAPIIGGQIAVDTQPLVPGTSTWLAALQGAPELPLLTHGLLALISLLSIGLALALRRVVPLPSARLLAPLGGFLLVASVTLTFSQYRSVSLAVWLEWTAAILILPAIVATAGRENGPRWLAAALVAGCTVTALRGIAEYGTMRAIDPTWRIFAGWVNQNALGGMLLLGLFPALGLLLTSERLAALAAATSASLIGFALVLSQSRGSFLAGAVGLVILVLVSIIIGRARSVRLLGPLLVVTLLVVGLQMTPPRAANGSVPGGPSGGVLSRVVDSQATQSQSAGFRLQLWRTAIALTKELPTGSGPGTFRFRSAKPGLVTSTILAHNSYLQIAAEASPVALVLLLIGILVWYRETLPGTRGEPLDRRLLRWAAIAGVTAALAHNLVDSDLYQFGFAVGLFGLMGIGLMWSRDALSPELLTRGIRLSGAFAMSVLLPFALIRFGLDEATKAQFVGLVTQGSANAEQLGDLTRRVNGLAQRDGEAAYLMALYGPDAAQPATRLVRLKDAVALAPSPRYFRAIARTSMEQGDVNAAEDALRRGLAMDPNNLPSLEMLLDFALQQRDEVALQAAANRLIAVESLPVFQIRAIPELVPTATFRARLALAERQTDPQAQVDLLKPALGGLERYRIDTLPRVRQAASTMPPSEFGGEGPTDARAAMELAARVADRCAIAYRAVGNGAEAGRALISAERFRSAGREASTPLPPG